MINVADTWYWNLGFSSNPFSTKPATLTNEVVGVQLEPILEKIDNGEIQFIEAPLGSGKTTLLKSIIARFGGKKKLIYASCIKNECLDLRGLLKNATLKGKLLNKLSKGMILMVDEAQNISREEAQEITDYLEQGNLKAVAFFGTNYNKKLLTNKLNDSLNGNITVLSYLTPEEAVELVRKRIGYVNLIPDYVIREIYGRSNSNPRRLLQNCEDVCRKASELSIKELTLTDAGTLLKTSEPAAAKKKRAIIKAKTSKKAKKYDKKKPKIKKTENHQTATVTYSGYNLENIRTYEEEMPTAKKGHEE